MLIFLELKVFLVNSYKLNVDTINNVNNVNNVACACRMDEPVARAARTVPEVAQALREEPGVDSVLALVAPADGAVSLVQFQAGNLDCTSVRLGVRRLGLRRASPAPLSQHGKSFTHKHLFFKFSRLKWKKK